MNFYILFLLLSSGDSYSGEWVDDQRHGTGILKLANGENLTDIFIHLDLTIIRCRRHLQWRVGC